MVGENITRKGLKTRAIHAGEAPDQETGASAPNLVMSSTFVVDKEVSFSANNITEETPFVYTRWSNPTTQQLEQKLANLEQTEACIAFASGMAARLGVTSCDHLEFARPDDVAAMAECGTVAVLLPGAFYFLRETQRPPVEAFRGAGVRMAVASDLNPGSSPIASLLICMHMACTLFGLTASEALEAVTRHGAAAMGMEKTAGIVDTEVALHDDIGTVEVDVDPA